MLLMLMSLLGLNPNPNVDAPYPLVEELPDSALDGPCDMGRGIDDDFCLIGERLRDCDDAFAG